jgi:hypothetical protein
MCVLKFCSEYSSQQLKIFRRSEILMLFVTGKFNEIDLDV